MKSHKEILFVGIKATLLSTSALIATYSLYSLSYLPIQKSSQDLDYYEETGQHVVQYCSDEIERVNQIIKSRNEAEEIMYQAIKLTGYTVLSAFIFLKATDITTTINEVIGYASSLDIEEKTIDHDKIESYH